jgi:hypothetical protein
MNTCPTARRTARPALFSLRAAVVHALLALACQGVLALGAEADREPAQTAATPAARLVAHHQRETATRQAGEVVTGPRQGMHVVVRVAVVDVVSHPDSGDVDLSPRSRLLSRSIARKPLAVGVTWRF